MRAKIVAVVMLLVAGDLFGAHVRVNFEDFGLTALTNRQVTLQLIGLNTDNGQFVSLESKVRRTDSTGSTTFSNCLTGVYLLKLASTPLTQFWLNIPNTNGTIAAANYVGSPVVLAGNVISYTRAQIDAMLFGSQTTNIIYTGIANVPSPRLLGRTTAGTGATEAISVGTGLTLANGSLSLYAPPVISAFTNNHNIVEIGTTNTQTVLGWTLGGTAITSQSLNQSIGALAIGLRTYTHTNTYSTDRTYTLTVSDGVTSPTANTTVSFQSKAYWGVSALTTLNDGEIQGLSREFATARQRTKLISASNQYIYLIYPAAFGLPTRFVANGFTDTAWTLEGGAAQNFVNASGATVSYYVYRSNDTALGDFTIEIE